MNPASIGKPLPQHPSFAGDCTARAFWRESYRVSRNYVRSLDALGQPILVQHERESPEGFSRRQRLTKPRNFVGPLVRRFNDFVWRLAPTRGLVGDAPLALADDVDGHGTSIDAFLKQCLIVAQVEREVFLFPDRVGDLPAEPGTVSRAEADSAGARPVVRRVTADMIPWWEDECGALEECIIRTGARSARYYGPEGTQEIQLSDEPGAAQTVVAISAEAPHGYSSIPVVRWRPSFDPLIGGPGESQASPMAEAQQGIAHFLSLLNEEIANVTFTQWIATGVSVDELKDIAVGNNRVLCIPRPEGKFVTLGADPAQAKTISERITDEIENLYRTAGVDFSATKGGPESGIAKAFRFNDLAATLAALADSTEAAENQLWKLLADGWGWSEVPSAKYADDFNLPDFSSELQDLIRSLVATELPKTIRRKLVDRFTSRNLPLSEDEETAVDAEMGEPPEPAAGGGMPGPARRPS